MTTQKNEKARIDALLLPHSIGGVHNPRQGIAQVVPEPVVLCLSCGWLLASEYHEHLVALLVIPSEQTCACEHPYIGTQKAGDPIRCEQCRLLIPPAEETR